MREREELYSKRSVTMPSETVMIKTLDATRLLLRHRGVLFRFVHSLAGQEEIGLTLVSAWEGACEDADGSVVGRMPQAVFLWLGSCQKPSPSVTRLPLHWNLAADDDGNQHRPFSRKHESGWRFSPAAKFFVNYACAQR